MTGVSPQTPRSPYGDRGIEEDEIPSTGNTYKIGPPIAISPPEIPRQGRAGE